MVMKAATKIAILITDLSLLIFTMHYVDQTNILSLD